MSHLIAYFGNEPDNMGCALFSARNALYSHRDEKLADDNQPQPPDERSRGGSFPEAKAGEGRASNGWSLGFIQGGDVLLQKRPRAEGAEIDLYALARDLKADAMIGRVGLGLDGNKAAENADPFRYRSWLFGSIGTVPSFDAIREKVLDAIPDYLRRNVRGRSASEHLFHLFLAYLHDAGILDLPSPVPAQVEAAVRSTLAFVSRLIRSASGGPEQAGSEGVGMELALVATNGRSLVATVCSHAMQFLTVDGIADCPVCHGRANPNGDGRRISHEQLRAVVIEANPQTQGRAGWRPIPDQSALIIGPDHVPHVTAATPAG